VMEPSSYGKVEQVDGTPVGRLDVETVVKASQALSSEIVLSTLIEKLMRLAVELAGAERGLLILLRGDQPHIEAEVTTGQGRPEVTVRPTAVTPSDLPQSPLHHVIRTRERVVLDDAPVRGPYSDDEYVRRRRPRSLLCLPIVKHTRLVGALYLENTLTASAFTSDRVAMLELLASQAAISLQNASLYSDLQRSEAASRESEQSLRRIVDTIPGFVCTLNPAGEIELLNRQILEYFGKTVEDLKNWAATDAVHPDDLPRVIDAWRRSVETGQPYENEHRERRADGVYRWFHSRALPARDTEGRITSWYMLLTDIDDRKRAEEESRRSKAYLTEAQRLSRTGSFGCSVSSGEMFWSDETFRIFGYDRAITPAVEAMLERVHPDDKARVQGQIHRATSEGTDCDLESRLLLPDGSIKHVHVVAHASKGQANGFEFMGAVMDVTAANEAQERIRQDERELRITIETIPAIVSSTLADGSIDFISERWLEYVGLSREEISGGAWKSTIHPDDLDRVLTNWQAALATGEPLEMETRYRRADGQYRWFLVRAVPLRDDTGKIGKWYATIFDIEDRKQTERKLQRSEAYLAEAQRLTHTGSFAQTIATGELTHSSEEHSRLFGFDPDEGNPSFEAIRQTVHPEDRDRANGVFERAVRERTDGEVEFRTVLPDGTIKYLHAIGHPVFNAAGDLVEYVGTVMDVTERRQAHDALEDLAGRLIRAQEEERSRIGRELHDHISQTLGVLTIKIDQLRAREDITPGIGGALDQLRQATTEITDDVHRLSHRLHSSTLDYLGLIPALQKLTAEFSERHGISVAFAYESVPAPLSSEIALCLFRVAEEGLANIAKHSQSRFATVQVKGEPDGIHLKVEDSGTGFDMTAWGSKAGLGFVSMQERLRALHGTLHVDSAALRGTRIKAWVPTPALPPADDEARAKSS
jgi:PAS domain S-box-containing protein